MAAGEDSRFSAIYTSIDDEEYEEYVQCSSAPAPYLVPQQSSSVPRQKPTGLFNVKKSTGTPPFVLTKPPDKPPPAPSNAPPALPRKKESYRHHGILDKPRPKVRAGTPANKMAETPLELGTLGKRNTPHPDNLPLLSTDTNIRGTLHPASASSRSDTPTERLTGHKYKALSSDAQTNEYASLKPLRKFKTDKLKERLRIKKRHRETAQTTQLEETQDSNTPSIYGDIDPPRESIGSDNSRVVCLLLSIIIVCLLISIASLIIAVYTIASFEHYKMSVTPHTREVNRCTVTVNSLPEIKKCNYTDDFEADWENSEGMFQEKERAFPLSCKARVDKELDESVKITASLEEEGQGNNAYCLCSIDHKVSGTTPSPTSSIKFPLNLTCIISETVLGNT